MLDFGFAFGGIEHGRVGVGPKYFLIVCDDGPSDDLVLEINTVLIFFVDHGLEELADVVGIESRRLTAHP